MSNYPNVFLKKKKRRGYSNRLRPSICPSVLLSPPKPLGEIQPNLMCGLLSCMGHATVNKVLAPLPGALRRGQKV